jgi:hypothetical protein
MIGMALRLLVLGESGAGEAQALPAETWGEEDSRLLSYSAAVTDMSIWTCVAAIILRSLMERAHDDAVPAAYLHSGFTDPVIAPVLGLDGEIRHAYALGAIAICSHDATRAALRRMLDLTLSLPVPAQVWSWNDSVASIENEVLLIFNRLQARVLTALGLPALPPASLAATVTETFGHLPSHYLAPPGACVRRGNQPPPERHV